MKYLFISVVFYFVVKNENFDKKIIGRWENVDKNSKLIHDFREDSTYIGMAIDLSIGNALDGYDTIVKYHIPYEVIGDSLIVDFSDNENNYKQRYKILKLTEDRLVLRHRRSKTKYFKINDDISN